MEKSGSEDIFFGNRSLNELLSIVLYCIVPRKKGKGQKKKSCESFLAIFHHSPLYQKICPFDRRDQHELPELLVFSEKETFYFTCFQLILAL